MNGVAIPICAVCEGWYHNVNQNGTACTWSCGVGTQPDAASNECVCQAGYNETGLDQFDRRACEQCALVGMNADDYSSACCPGLENFHGICDLPLQSAVSWTEPDAYLQPGSTWSHAAFYEIMDPPRDQMTQFDMLAQSVQDLTGRMYPDSQIRGEYLLPR